MADLCDICCSTKLTDSAKATCPMCEHTCCKKCVKRFLLDLFDDPQCMNCRRRFTHEHLVLMLPRCFVNAELKQHREAVLLDRQKALLPATQGEVEHERTRRVAMGRVRALQAERDALRRRLGDLERQIRTEEMQMVRATSGEPRREFFAKCSAPGCRGFLTEQYKCTACNRRTCPRCLALKDDGGEDGHAPPHVCNEADVASVALIRGDSKRCPSCSAWIFRVEGCSQMFCTSCHKMFDYRTLRLIGSHEHFHNPHYAEWLASRRGGGPHRELGDIPCGGMPHVNEMYAITLERFGIRREHAMEIIRQHRVVLHVEMVSMLQFRTPVDDQRLRQLRVQYSLGDFDEAAWRIKLQRLEKDRNKRAEIYMILEMVVQACGDLFRQMLALETSGRTVHTIHNEVCQVIDHANTALRRVAVAFSCSVPQVKAQTVGSESHATARRALIGHFETS